MTEKEYLLVSDLARLRSIRLIIQDINIDASEVKGMSKLKEAYIIIDKLIEDHYTALGELKQDE